MSKNLVQAWSLRRKKARLHKMDGLTQKERLVDREQSIANSADEATRAEMMEDAGAREVQDTDYDGPSYPNPSRGL